MGASERVRVGRGCVPPAQRESPGGTAVVASERVPVVRADDVLGRGEGRPSGGVAVVASERGARGTRTRALARRREGTLGFCSGCVRTGARGTTSFAQERLIKATWRCCSGRVGMGASGTRRRARGAAAGGHLEVLRWLRRNGCPWNETTCSGAAMFNHLEVLQWARENGCPWTTSDGPPTPVAARTWSLTGARVLKIDAATSTRKRGRDRERKSEREQTDKDDYTDDDAAGHLGNANERRATTTAARAVKNRTHQSPKKILRSPSRVTPPPVFLRVRTPPSPLCSSNSPPHRLDVPRVHGVHCLLADPPRRLVPRPSPRRSSESARRTPPSSRTASSSLSPPDDTAVFFFRAALLFATTTSLGYHVPNLPQKTMTGTFIAASSESLIPAGTFSLE